jgi:hypothetical protein
MTFLEQNECVSNYISDQLKRYVAFSTNGKLSLTSTGGSITVDAPIPDNTGEVAITAANAIIVNHKVFSNNQPISLAAGAGGITVNGTDDTYGIMGYGIGPSPAIDSGSGPLTLQALGDVSITKENGIATTGKLAIDTRGKIETGTVTPSLQSPSGYKYPSEIELVADEGIGSSEHYFKTGDFIPLISATSANGAIYLEVFKPGKLTINAPSPTVGDVYTGYFIGDDVNIYAGRDINLDNVLKAGTLKLTAGRDANLKAFYDITSLDVTAGNDIRFSSGLNLPYATIWLNGGDLKATSTGGSILFNNYSAIHIGGGKSLTLNAYGSVELGILETLGPVNITAQTGYITLRNDIGPPIPVFDPTGEGVASLALNAGSNIDMQGAKASGAVNITAGSVLTSTKGIYSGTANGVTITATGGALEKLSGGDVSHPGPYTFTGTSFGNIPLDIQDQLTQFSTPPPTIMPGPTVAPPGLPGALTALAALPPGLATVSGYALSPDVGVPLTPGPEQEVEANRLASNVQLSEIIPVEDEEEGEEENRKKIMKISDGRSARQVAELGLR